VAVKLSVPHHRQKSEAGCLPACVAMVLAYWQDPHSQEAISRSLGTDPHVGTPASRVLRLRSRSLSVFYGQASPIEIRQWLEARVPVIALVHTLELPYWSQACAHAVVVIGVDEGSVWVNDPARVQAPVRVPMGDFILACGAMDNYVAVIRPSS